MFIIELTYRVPLEVIDDHMKEHMDFLNTQYAKGVFLMSGRKLPRDGGIIIANARSKRILSNIMVQDPFMKLQLATFTITEFKASQVAPKLKEVLKED